MGFKLENPSGNVAVMLCGTNGEYFPVESDLINLCSVQGLCLLRSKKWQLYQTSGNFRHNAEFQIQNSVRIFSTTHLYRVLKAFQFPKTSRSSIPKAIISLYRTCARRADGQSMCAFSEENFLICFEQKRNIVPLLTLPYCFLLFCSP